MTDYTPLPNKSIKDIRGQRFGRLTVIRFSHTHRQAYWICLCDCGKEVIVLGVSLRDGHTESCGCLHRSAMQGGTRTTHGLSDTSEYHIWASMKERCCNPSNAAYPHYGGRGITICDRWLNDFAVFYMDMGPRPSPKHSLDRIDNDGAYSPDNCRWATRTEQANNKRSNLTLTWNGETHTVSEWAKLIGLSRHIIVGRLRMGWTSERILSTPKIFRGVRRARV